MPSQLNPLRPLSAVVADSSDIDAMVRFRPFDATRIDRELIGVQQ